MKKLTFKETLIIFGILNYKNYLYEILICFIFFFIHYWIDYYNFLSDINLKKDGALFFSFIYFIILNFKQDYFLKNYILNKKKINFYKNIINIDNLLTSVNLYFLIQFFIFNLMFINYISLFLILTTFLFYLLSYLNFSLNLITNKFFISKILFVILFLFSYYSHLIYFYFKKNIIFEIIFFILITISPQFSFFNEFSFLNISYILFYFLLITLISLQKLRKF